MRFLLPTHKYIPVRVGIDFYPILCDDIHLRSPFGGRLPRQTMSSAPTETTIPGMRLSSNSYLHGNKYIDTPLGSSSGIHTHPRLANIALINPHPLHSWIAFLSRDIREAYWWRGSFCFHVTVSSKEMVLSLYSYSYPPWIVHYALLFINNNNKDAPRQEVIGLEWWWVV